MIAREEEASEAEVAFKDSQHKMQQAVKDLSSNIEVKEQLMAELTENAQRFEAMRTHYESAVLQREAEAASTQGKRPEPTLTLTPTLTFTLALALAQTLTLTRQALRAAERARPEGERPGLAEAAAGARDQVPGAAAPPDRGDPRAEEAAEGVRAARAREP